MTVAELQRELAKMPQDWEVVSFQPVIEMMFNGSEDVPRFVEFRDVKLKRVSEGSFGQVRIN